MQSCILSVWHKIRNNAYLLCSSFSVLFVGIFSFRVDFKFDDPYIAFRVVENLLRRNGWVYNVGEHVNVATSPLHVIVLALIKFLFPGVDIWILAHWFDVLCLLSASVFLCCILNILYPRNLLAQLVPLTVLICPFVFVGTGLETALYLALSALSWLFFLRKNYSSLGIILGLLILTRHDGVIAASVIMLLICWREAKFSWRTLFFMLWVILPWFFFAKWYFGDCFPHTLYAKTAQIKVNIYLPPLRWPFSLFPRGGMFLQEFIKAALPRFQMERFYFICLLFLLQLLAGELKRFMQTLSQKRGDIPYLTVFFFMGVFYFLGYMMVNVYGYPWYYGPIMFYFLLALHLALCQLQQLFEMVNINSLVLAVWVIAIPFFTKTSYHEFFGWSNIDDIKVIDYKIIGKFIKDHSFRKADLVQMTEIGVVGYYAQVRVLDNLGLVSPLIVKNQMLTRDWQWGFRTFKPAWIIPGDPCVDWASIHQNYHSVVSFQGLCNLYLRNDIPELTSVFPIKNLGGREYRIINSAREKNTDIIYTDIEYIGQWRRQKIGHIDYYVARRSEDGRAYSDFIAKIPYVHQSYAMTIDYLDNKNGRITLALLNPDSTWSPLLSLDLQGDGKGKKVNVPFTREGQPFRDTSYFIFDTHGMDFYVKDIRVYADTKQDVTLWLGDKYPQNICIKYMDWAAADIHISTLDKRGNNKKIFSFGCRGDHVNKRVVFPVYDIDVDPSGKLNLTFDTGGKNFYFEDIAPVIEE